jgi:uncharacterized protein YqiB (DUF1249 family)
MYVFSYSKRKSESSCIELTGGIMELKQIESNNYTSVCLVETKHNNLAYLSLLTTTIKIESKVIKNYQ